MKMGTASPWRYDGEADRAPPIGWPRRPTILRYALWPDVFPIRRVLRDGTCAAARESFSTSRSSHKLYCHGQLMGRVSQPQA
jgi:hypothetical protein